MIVSKKIDNLNKMYDSSFYTQENGICKYYNECRPNQIGNKFCCDRCKVGEKYGMDGVPKIVFVGLEGKHDEVKIIQPINLTDQECKPSKTVFNLHYKGVRYTLSYLISGIVSREKPQRTIKYELNKDEFNSDLKSTTTSSTKCIPTPKSRHSSTASGLQRHFSSNQLHNTIKAELRLRFCFIRNYGKANIR